MVSRELKALFEATREKLAAANTANESLTRDVERLRSEGQAQKSKNETRLDQLEAMKKELAAMDGLVTETQRAVLLRDVDRELSEHEAAMKSEAEAFDRQLQEAVDKVNTVRKTVRELEGRVELHDRIQSQGRPKAADPKEAA